MPKHDIPDGHEANTNLIDIRAYLRRRVDLTAQDRDDQARNAWLYDADGRAIIHVNMPAQGEAVPGIGDRGRMDHVAFDCRDPDAMEARLTALGIPYRRRATLVDGLTQIVLRDPNGINLELAFGTERALAASA